ncbi:fatty acid cis/trans isomerase [Amphritea sp. 1_MG-2023]|uniref:fatty acid cis/trans isomerase n=1 Tax=Amphritea sp. 1_MG-2023 TaxID=3062670 RepID=UPI0026E46CB7|nr:fatty acid cis/trans isomerase [Amphritea sp. 1_MG-2023]MDO6563115.1 fatty acid cis/trans isomerase [Amphritea sp. 1_MG-2023]
MKKLLQRKTYISLLLIAGMLFFLSGSDKQNQEINPRQITEEQSYRFSQHISPILDEKCLACHACYDAPCQLKMESHHGVERGASKLRVYDGGRLNDLSPTRLYIDAQTPQEWRAKGFYSVLDHYSDNDSGAINRPLMQRMLDLGYQNPLPANQPVPETIQLGFDRVNSCPAPGEFTDYAEQFPHGGMPLAVAGLTQQEYQTLSTWLTEGAKIDTPGIAIDTHDQAMIQRWEQWLNQPDKRSQLLARYLYEHLFLGHLYLQTDSQTASKLTQTTNKMQFYQLIRSYTAEGAPVIVPTVRPNDDPQKAFFYRLIPLAGTIVHKTHITYRFDAARLQRYQQLFSSHAWDVTDLPGYNFAERSNPFITFAAIPAKLRYRFLLDDAQFFVRNFIRGPVCRGQIATNVIRDQFWVMFESPDQEHYTNNEDYQLTVNPYLGLPGENTSLLKFGSEWLTYNDNRNHYLSLREKAYRQAFPAGTTVEQIWNGEHSNPNAFLTVFRHHNSASVTQGWQGEIPLTAWVMGYPLLERTYYELVANFDVFGSVSHQAQTRLYFDLIRNGSETNFLRFMPASARQKIYDNWYQSSAKLKASITYYPLDTHTPSDIIYHSDKPMQEFLQTLQQQYPEISAKIDPLNRCKHCEQPHTEPSAIRANQALSQLAAIPASQLAGIKWLPEVSFLRINLDSDAQQQTDNNVLAYTLLRNRRHSSVAYLLGESLRYQENLDSLTILPMPIGSYPNLILQMNLSEIDEFVAQFRHIDSDKSYRRFLQRWAVGRMNSDFWGVFHSFKTYLEKTNPLEAGVYDMNRYGH